MGIIFSKIQNSLLTVFSRSYMITII